MKRQSAAVVAAYVPVAAAAFATLLVLGTVGSVGTVSGESDQPTLRLTDGTTTDGNTSVDVILTSAPDGLAGYYLDLSVESPDGAHIVDASYPAAFGLTSTPEYSDGGETVTLEAADLNDTVGPGSTGVRLATVTVEDADAAGPDLAVDPRQFDADDGSVFTPAQASDVDDRDGDNTDSESGDGDSSDGSESSNDDSTDSGGSSDGDSSDGSGSNGDDSTDGGSSDSTDNSSDGDSTGDTGERDATPDGSSNQSPPSSVTPVSEKDRQEAPATTGVEASAGETATRVSPSSTDTAPVEVSALSFWPIAVVGLVVVLVLGLVRLRR